MKRERWPLDGLHRRTIPPLRPIEAGWRFWHAALLKLSDTFSRPQKTTFILQRKRLGGNEIARWKCCSCTHTYVYIRVQRERVERRRRRRRQGWAASFLLLFPDVLQWKRLDEARLLQLSTARELQKRRLDLRPLSRPRQFRGRYRSGYDVFHAQCLEEKLIRKDE